MGEITGPRPVGAQARRRRGVGATVEGHRKGGEITGPRPMGA
ncbi:hypothetical protein TIFTF001_003288 [Ficus carica]|uniref:Uncharacterized protein n=1 Tax=Ficus carica TaxID=3494 RepID=A0AA87ZCM9_FICCA|nr:hypothetical protein TIFTF001_003288 [Ficus carica]